MSFSSPFSLPQPVNTVQGPIDYEDLGTTDSHNHLWIDPVQGAAENAPVLDQFDQIVMEVEDYRKAGGRSIMDCQPEGCGRNGARLLEISKRTDVHVIACTGFHRKKYYPQEHWLFNKRAQKVCDFLTSELETGLYETLDFEKPVKAGFIKIALEGIWADCPMNTIDGAIQAAMQTGKLIEIHTEKGALAEKACLYFTDAGLSSRQIVLCHMDKRSDTGLHKELAKLGVLLEYDTFYRPKYDPEQNLWPLIDFMVNNELSGSVSLATDMAESELYHHIGGGPGLASFPGEIRGRLIERGTPEPAIKQLLGGNIARRLVGLN